MKNQKLKLALSELEKEMEVISKEEMKSFKGGGNGTQDDPYTYDEYLNFLVSGSFEGGYVEDIGYVNKEEMVLSPVVAMGTESSTGGILSFYENNKYQIDGFLFSNSTKVELIGIAESMDEISSVVSKYSALFKTVGAVGGGLQAAYYINKMSDDYYNNGHIESIDMLDLSVSVVGTAATIFLGGTPVGAAIAVGTGAYFIYRFITEN